MRALCILALLVAGCAGNPERANCRTEAAATDSRCAYRAPPPRADLVLFCVQRGATRKCEYVSREVVREFLDRQADVIH